MLSAHIGNASSLGIQTPCRQTAKSGPWRLRPSSGFTLGWEKEIENSIMTKNVDGCSERTWHRKTLEVAVPLLPLFCLLSMSVLSNPHSRQITKEKKARCKPVAQ
jgi:hypothetical protein